MSARVPRKMTGEAFRIHTSDLCLACASPVEGWIAFNRESRVVGSEGFMVSARGLVCDECLARQGAPTSRAVRT